MSNGQIGKSALQLLGPVGICGQVAHFIDNGGRMPRFSSQPEARISGQQLVDIAAAIRSTPDSHSSGFRFGARIAGSIVELSLRNDSMSEKRLATLTHDEHQGTFECDLTRIAPHGGTELTTTRLVKFSAGSILTSDQFDYKEMSAAQFRSMFGLSGTSPLDRDSLDNAVDHFDEALYTAGMDGISGIAYSKSDSSLSAMGSMNGLSVFLSISPYFSAAGKSCASIAMKYSYTPGTDIAPLNGLGAFYPIEIPADGK